MSEKTLTTNRGMIIGECIKALPKKNDITDYEHNRYNTDFQMGYDFAVDDCHIQLNKLRRRKPCQKKHK